MTIIVISSLTKFAQMFYREETAYPDKKKG
jgi:hypothetical protein